MIELYPVQVLNEKGQRDYNQDSVYPEPGQTGESSSFFMVCDGVGGSSRGEVASRLLCENFGSYFAKTQLFSQENLSNALSLTMEAMDSFIQKTGEGESMASTLTFVGFEDQKVVFGHVGDSRIYHIREGRILYRTKDHSLMNQWIDNGIITPEEAEVHPKKNHVTRAVVAGSRQVEIEFETSDDVRAGDFFFLCSDGILEGIDDDQLLDLMVRNTEVKAIIDQIATHCRGKSRDNFSACLIKVKDIVERGAANPKTEKNSVLKKYAIPGSALIASITLLGFLLSDDKQVSTKLHEDQAETIESELEQLRNLDTLSLEAPAPPTLETTEE